MEIAFEPRSGSRKPWTANDSFLTVIARDLGSTFRASSLVVLCTYL